MNGSVIRLFKRRVSSESFDTRLGQGVCFGGSGIVGLVSWWKLTQFELTEVQFYLGLLLSLCVPLLLIIVGMLLPSARTAANSPS